MKIVINTGFFGLCLSLPAMRRYAELKAQLGQTAGMRSADQVDIPRDDPTLVQVVEELGGKESSRYSALKVVEIPDNVKWRLMEYEGREHIAEVHRTWD